MSAISLYDEKRLAELAMLQRRHNWDLESSIAWATPIDLDKPLVPLDDWALSCPGAGPEERLAISQMMGLIIASSICEMEGCLLRLRKDSFDDVFAGFPVNPEFRELGEQFFIEEEKHARAFRRYLERFSQAAGVDASLLRSLLPVLDGTRTEALLRRSLRFDSRSFWWIVATVEEEFLALHARLAPFSKTLEPLYFDLHQKHFEEEARHSPFPFLMLELLRGRGGWLDPVRDKGGLVFAQLLIASWSMASLRKVRGVVRLRGAHPLFGALAAAYALFERQPPGRILWRMFTRTPYVSSLVNPSGHAKVLRAAGKAGALSIPLPALDSEPLVDY